MTHQLASMITQYLLAVAMNAGLDARIEAGYAARTVAESEAAGAFGSPLHDQQGNKMNVNEAIEADS